MRAARHLQGGGYLHERQLSLRYRRRAESVGKLVHFFRPYHQCAGYLKAGGAGESGSHGRTGFRHGSGGGYGYRRGHHGGIAEERMPVSGDHPLSGGERVRGCCGGAYQCQNDL